MAIQFSFRLTREDFVTFYTYVFWDSPQNKRKRIWYYIRQFLPLLAFSLAFYYTGVFNRNDIFVFLVVILIIATTGLSLFNVRSNTQRAAERIAENKDNSTLFEDCIMEISELGIISKTNYSEMKYGWPAFIRKNETPEYYFLFTSAIHAIIIPKRAIPTPAQKLELEKLLLHHISFEADFS